MKKTKIILQKQDMKYKNYLKQGINTKLKMIKPE